VYRFIFASKRLTPDIDKTFHDAVVSFRRMSLAETSSAKPLRIRIVTVAEDDTVEKIAARMSIHDRAIERFRILNGLTATDRVKPGDQVKIVTE
jgi:predicted Zn-dependent protease